MMLSLCLASIGLILALLAEGVTSSVLTVDCGDEITKNTVLGNDLDCYCDNIWAGYESCTYYDVCGFDCSVVVKGPATMDLNGHNVFGLRTDGKGATIKNGITSGGINVQNALLKNIIATGSGLTLLDNCTLLNVTTKDNYGVGIVVQGSNNRLTGVTAIGGGINVVGDNNRLYNVKAIKNGISISGDKNQVKDSYIAQAGCVTIADGDGNVFKNNTVRRCSGYGVYIEGAINSIIADNRFYATSRSSIFVFDWDSLFPTTKNRITRNKITKSGAEGIVLEYTQNAVVESNVIVGSAKDGIVLKSTSSRGTIKNNTVRNCGTAGIRIRGADDNNVTGNTVTSCRTGILAGVEAKRNRLINNRASKSIVFDLSDMTANCGSNVWKGNTGKGNIACTQNK